MNVRQQVADAVNDALIDGVTGSVYPPQTKRPGVTWAQWVATSMRQMSTGAVVHVEDAWQVLCLLPDVDPQQTTTALDIWMPAVCDALAPHFRITRGTPASVVVADGSAVPAFSISIVAP